MAQTAFGEKNLNDQDIQRAITEFDARYPDTNLYDSWLEKGTYKYAIFQNDKLYPPKFILSLATGFETTSFNAGEARRVLGVLGFQARKKPEK